MSNFPEPLQDITLSTLVQWCCSGAMIFGGVIPYIPQYREIKKTDNADGFSLHVCLSLLVANILRILYWFGHGFELPLLIQSIIMIFTMMLMVRLCVSVKHRTQIIKGKDRVLTGLSGASASKLLLNHTFSDFDPNFFWKWTDFQSYLECTLLFSAISTVMVYILHHSVMFVEAVGVLAVFTESMLGVPQLIRNFAQGSTQGMSLSMVLMWTSGDSFKTGYFLVRQAPIQFVAGAVLQVAVDCAILAQVWHYRKDVLHSTPSVAAASRHKAHELVE